MYSLLVVLDILNTRFKEECIWSKNAGGGWQIDEKKN